MNEIDRREALKMLGLGLLSVGTGSAALYGHFDARRSEAQPSATAAGEADRAGLGAEQQPAPWWLLAPFAAGFTIGAYRIASMTGVVDGVVNLGLEASSGEPLNVTICRRDDSPEAPNPIARTEYYDLFLPNGGKGDMPTDEANGRVVLALGMLAERNEKKQAPLPLETLQQSWRRA